MYVSQLSLTHFRNYRRLGLELRPGVVLLCGENGQGKTNLLESVYVLATTRSPRTSVERELVQWRSSAAVSMPSGLPAPDEPPFARLEARVHRQHSGDAHVEVSFRGDGVEPLPEGSEDGTGEVTSRLARSIKVNGLPTRASALLGQMMVVYFAPEDVSLAGGSPTARRRYLDLASSQVAPLYLRALQQYNRILLQRNQVLRQVRERRQQPAALAPWTDQLIRTGAFILRHRLQMLDAVNARADQIHADLAGTGQAFRVQYRGTAFAGEPDRAPDTREIAAAYRQRQEAAAAREIEQAASLVGPHRDDFTFLLDGVDLNAYGSRGQQRLAVLALKLAEADWMLAETGESPVILLDDVLSELDPRRRAYVLNRVIPSDATAAERQVWITTTDLAGFDPALTTRAQRYSVDAGTVRLA